MFVESLGSATLHNGIIRIECRVRGATGQDQSNGHLVIPAVNAVNVARQLGAILTEMGKKLEEAKAQQGQQAGGQPAPAATS